MPYQPQHVDTYFAWLSDAHISEMTATEAVEHALEVACQEEFSRSANKFTKLIQVKASGRLVGDFQIFYEPEGGLAEINTMIAEAECRKMGYAGEALDLGMAYAVQLLGVQTFFVKVLAKNAAGLRLFESHGFRRTGEVDVFGEYRLEIEAAALPKADLCIVTGSAVEIPQK